MSKGMRSLAVSSRGCRVSQAMARRAVASPSPLRGLSSLCTTHAPPLMRSCQQAAGRGWLYNRQELPKPVTCEAVGHQWAVGGESTDSETADQPAGADEAEADEGSTNDGLEGAAPGVLLDFKQLHAEATAEVRAGREGSALRLLQQGMERFPDNPRFAFSAARIHASRRGGLGKARELFSVALAAAPGDSVTLQAWAVMESRIGDPARAGQLFSEAVQADPCHAAALQAWGMHEKRLGDLQRSMELIERAAMLGHVYGLLALGQLEEEQGHVDRAIKFVAPGPTCVTVRISPGQSIGNQHKATGLTGALSRSVLIGSIGRLPSWTPPTLQPGRCVGHGSTPSTFARLRVTKDQSSMDLLPALAACPEAGVLVLSPNGPVVHQAWASLNFKLGKVSEARKLFAAGDAGSPMPHVPLLCAWAGMEAKHELLSTARKLYSRALTAHPGDMHSLLGLGTLEARSGNIRRAVALYEKALSHEPKSLRVRHALAQLHMQQGSTQGARALLEELLRDHPGSARARFTLGELEQRDGNFDRAFELYVGGIGQKGRDVMLCYEGCAGLAEFQGKPQAARRYFLEAWGRFGPWKVGSPGSAAHARLLRMWALFERRQGNVEEARQLFSKSAEAWPKDGRTWLQWGILERRAKEWESARTVFSNGLKVSPRSPDLWQAFAVSEVRAGNIEAARRLFKKGISKCPRDAPLRMEFAQTEASAGRLTVAREMMAKAAEEAGRYPPLYAAWADLEAQAGNVAKAAELDAEYSRCIVEQEARRERKLRRGRQTFEDSQSSSAEGPKEPTEPKEPKEFQAPREVRLPF